MPNDFVLPTEGFDSITPRTFIASRPPADPANPLSRAFEDMDSLLTYVMGGFGTLTVQACETGKRFTFKMGKPRRDNNVFNGRKPRDPKKPKPIFVSVLTGPSNTSDYQFMGCLWPGDNLPLVYSHGKRSRFTETAPSVIAFRWFLGKVLHEDASLLRQANVWHEGTCYMCGKTLTTPESVEAGIGPICAGRLQSR